MSEQMLEVPAAEAELNFALYQEKALIQPVAVRREGGGSVVMISAEEYARLKRHDRQAILVSELTEAEIAAVAAAEPPPEAAAHDHEVG